jgi:hypothetical protein
MGEGSGNRGRVGHGAHSTRARPVPPARAGKRGASIG